MHYRAGLFIFIFLFFFCWKERSLGIIEEFLGLSKDRVELRFDRSHRSFFIRIIGWIL